MHTAKQITKNSFFFTGALIGQKVLSTLYFWFYSNHLQGGAVDVGRFQFALSFVTLFFILGDLGLYLVFLRESSKAPDKANAYFNTLIAIKAPLMLIAGFVVLIAAHLYHQADFSLILLGLLWIALDNITMLLYAIPRSRQVILYESIGVMGAQVVTAAVGVASLYIFGDVKYLLIALIAGTALNGIFAASVVVFKYRFTIRPRFDKKIALMFLKAIPAFAIAGILVKVMNSIDVVLVQKFTGNYADVGLYSIPLKLITALSLTLPTALMGAIYPAFSHLYGKSEEALRMVFKNAVDYLLIIAVPISFGFLALGDEFIGALWNQTYTGAILPAKIMLFSLPFIFLSFPTGNLLNATGQQKFTALSRGFGVVTLVIADSLLISRLHVIGAAIGLLCAHFVILSCDVYFSRKRVLPFMAHLFAQFSKILLSAVAMFIFLQALSPFVRWYALAVLGGGLYFAILFAVGGLNIKFLKHIR
jgi:O-antigen/teichoic acid export membrane protein